MQQAKQHGTQDAEHEMYPYCLPNSVY